MSNLHQWTINRDYHIILLLDHVLTKYFGCGGKRLEALNEASPPRNIRQILKKSLDYDRLINYLFHLKTILAELDDGIQNTLNWMAGMVSRGAREGGG